MMYFTSSMFGSLLGLVLTTSAFAENNAVSAPAAPAQAAAPAVPAAAPTATPTTGFPPVVAAAPAAGTAAAPATPPAPPSPPALALTTNAFLDGGALPVLYTCDGQNISPQFSWTTPPAKVQSFVFIVEDPEPPTAGNGFEWLVYNIPGSTTELAQGLSATAPIVFGKNSQDKTNYNGPCPAKGSVHTYSYTLYALDSKLNLAAGVDGKTLTDTMKPHILQKSTITGVYSRWP